MPKQTPFRIKLLVLLAFLGISLFATNIPSYAQDNESELFLVAQKAFEDGFYDVAMRYIDQLLQEHPQTKREVQAKLLLGQCYFFKSQYLKAYDTFQGLVKHSEFKDATLFWLGETYLKGADYKQAEKQYRQLIKMYPDSDYTPQAYYSLGWSYFEQNDLPKAKETFLSLIRKFPMHQLTEDASFKLAESEYNLHNYENAIQYFKDYVLKFPKSRRHAQAYFYIAEAYYYLEDFLTAVTYYAKTAEIAYDDKLILMARVSLGWSYLKLEKYNLAQQNFDEAYQFAREKGILSDDVFLGQATFYAETGDLTKAIGAYEELIQKFPHSERITEAYLGLANTYYQNSEYPKAIKNYQIIIDRSLKDTSQKPNLEKAYFGLAWAYLKSGDINAAVKSFETIKSQTESKTVKISALTQIGDAYQDAGQFQNAIDVYDNILVKYPDSPYTDYVQYRQAIALLKMEKVEAATMSFQSLQTNFPTSKYLNDINYYLAVAYFKKENWTVAREYIVDFIKGLPRSNEFLSEAYYILALSNFNLKEFKESQKTFYGILRDYPDELALVKNAQMYIAKCDYKMGETPTALSEFQTLIKKYPGTKIAQEAFMWLGDHYLETSDFDQAIVYYQKFINDFPGSERITFVYYELGRAYEAQEEYDQAVDAFKRIDPTQDPELGAKAKLAIADIFSKDLDPEAGVQIYQNIIETSPRFKRNAYVKIAEIYRKSRNYPAAVSAYKKALASNSINSDYSNAELQFMIADTYQLSNKDEQAVDEYLKIPYLYPNETAWIIKAYLRTARIFEDNEQWEEAKITYKKITHLNTDESKFAQERIDWINENVK